MKAALLILPLALAATLPAAEKPGLSEARPAQQWNTGRMERSRGSPDAWRIWDEQQWRETWQQHFRQGAPPAPDFSKGSVVVVSGGEQPSGGHWVEAVRAVRDGNEWTVEFVVHKPAPGAFVPMVLTYPAVFAFFEGVDLGRRPAWRDVTPREKPAEDHPKP
jgi:hypothetical protein